MGLLRGFLTRRPKPSAPEPSRPAAVTVAQILDDLGAQLLNHPHAPAMRHVIAVHDVLGRKGWRGVQALPSAVLGRAGTQAGILLTDGPSEALTLLVERLAAMKIAAEIREDRAPPPVVARPPMAPVEPVRPVERRVERVIVSEATHEEFDEVERSWTGTLPEAVAAAMRGQ